MCCVMKRMRKFCQRKDNMEDKKGNAKSANEKVISPAVIKRLPRYYRYLGDLLKNDVVRISSKELSQKMNVTASQIRQDLNNFGGFGQQGYGYNVEFLYNEMGKILGLDKTNNIINSIMPFDIENCVKYNSNYLRGYTSEKRDMDIDDLRQIVDKQSKDVARFAANDTLKQYDRGVRWKTENLNVKGKQWKTAYLPVWLYSYQEKKGDKSILHYVAVNARTKETMGSVPIHMSKLILVSVIVEIIALILMLFVDLDDNGWVFLLAGPLYYGLMYMKYRNKKARHYHEIETKRKIFNLKKSDVFVKTETGLSNSRIEGANNTRVNG